MRRLVGTAEERNAPAPAHVAIPVPKDRSQAPNRLRVRFFSGEWTRMCAKAHAEGLTVTEWAVRELLRAAK